MNIYEARWKNAVQIAKNINLLIDSGYIIFDENFKVVKYKFVITDDEILLPVSANCSNIYFLRDSAFDNGAHMRISEYNERFKDWKAVKPSSIQTLFNGESMEDKINEK